MSYADDDAGEQGHEAVVSVFAGAEGCVISPSLSCIDRLELHSGADGRNLVGKVYHTAADAALL